MATDGYVQFDPSTGETSPVAPDKLFDREPDPGPEILAQEPLTASRQATVDRAAVGAGYLPKREAIGMVNLRAAQMFGPPIGGIGADQIYRSAGGRGR